VHEEPAQKDTELRRNYEWHAPNEAEAQFDAIKVDAGKALRSANQRLRDDARTEEATFARAIGSKSPLLTVLERNNSNLTPAFSSGGVPWNSSEAHYAARMATVNDEDK
jgi:hypothetical protein